MLQNLFSPVTLSDQYYNHNIKSYISRVVFFILRKVKTVQMPTCDCMRASGQPFISKNLSLQDVIIEISLNTFLTNSGSLEFANENKD